ncbi:MAG: hypothetical protein OEM00_12735, partial [Burkholderiaceae bacterium]|nr:hypothetical protein [Burkholderiaceae bacterium]
VEMQTGEGKTLTAGIAAALIASAGVPVHVATVNDYLAQRDADELRPLFDFLGLSVGTVITGMDVGLRRASYSCNITYCTGKELVFDYLKDRVAVGSESNQARVKLHGLLGGQTNPLLLRGLHFAIVDEADSMFIDEARTPLILSENAGPPTDSLLYEEALAIARALREREHFVVRLAHHELLLTPAGRQFVTERCVTLGREWTVRLAREHWVSQALRALHMFHRDQHYIVQDDKVQIVDEQTGRVLPGRMWEQGLHQMIESKEGCKFSDQARTVARITYQRFFRRFIRLSGMTGTAREVRGELWRVYGLELVSVPTHRPSQRRYGPTRCVATEAQKWALVADRAGELTAAGRPVLIGTRSVEASEALSHVLQQRGLSHRVLNARQDAGEADLVSTAGEPGMLTVATNMAGRGTDIKLPAAVVALGGLHVILTEFHESKRVDRQLFGRAARQGDPGSVQAIVSLQDLLFRQYAPHLLKLINQLSDWRLRSPVIEFVRRQAQRRAERIHARTRSAAVKEDKRIETMLSFSGKS